MGLFSAEAMRPAELSVTALETFKIMLDNTFSVHKISRGNILGLWQLLTPKVQTLIYQLEEAWKQAATRPGTCLHALFYLCACLYAHVYFCLTV